MIKINHLFKKIFYLIGWSTVLIGVVICSGCLHHAAKTDINFAASYFTSSEAMYQRIEINNLKLRYTYFDDMNNKCARWLQQFPCWLQDDLKTVERTLAQNKIDDIIKLVNITNFLDLDSTYGGAKEGQRYYSEIITVRIHGKDKTVTYQSFPGAVPQPQAFTALQQKILELVKLMKIKTTAGDRCL